MILVNGLFLPFVILPLTLMLWCSLVIKGKDFCQWFNLAFRAIAFNVVAFGCNLVIIGNDSLQWFNYPLDSSVGRASAFGAGGRGFESRGRTIPKV